MGCTVIAALTLAAGCAAEPAGEGTTDDVNVSVSTSVTPRGVTVMRTTTCDATTTPAKQLIATKLVKYVFGNDAFAPPTTTTACSTLKNALGRFRTGIANGTLTVGKGYADHYCATSDSPHYDIDDFNSVNGSYIRSIITDLKANSDACYGAGTLAFLMPYDEDWGDGAYFIMDPEAATLTANLASTSGASAAAYYTNTPDVTTTAVKWGGTYASCGSFPNVVAGAPCSTVGLVAGQQAQSMIVKKSGTTLCACL
jgi:hypothetical protein